MFIKPDCGKLKQTFIKIITEQYFNEKERVLESDWGTV
jgi:hypothetical protein